MPRAVKRTRIHISCDVPVNGPLNVLFVAGRYYQVGILTDQEAVLRRRLAEQPMGGHRGTLCRDVSIDYCCRLFGVIRILIYRIP